MIPRCLLRSLCRQPHIRHTPTTVQDRHDISCWTITIHSSSSNIKYEGRRRGRQHAAARNQDILPLNRAIHHDRETKNDNGRNKHMAIQESRVPPLRSSSACIKPRPLVHPALHGILPWTLSKATLRRSNVLKQIKIAAMS
jgi:hypothetical protein